VRQGDDGDSAAADSAASLNALAAEFEPGLPLTDREIDGLFESLSAAIDAAYRAEVEAHSALSEVMGG
jgi:hypothetical protein